MNKNIVIVLIILVFIAVGSYLFMNKSQPSKNQGAVTSQNKNSTSSPQTIQGTLKSLITSGKSQKCTYSNKLKETTVEGTFYVAGGKLRGDFTTTSAQTKMNGHMIVHNGYSYIWSDLSKQGIKMAINQEQLAPSTPPVNTKTQMPDINQSYSYTCQGWSGDSAIFVPPATITFSTLALPSVQPTGTATGVNTNSAACSACDRIPAGSTRDACKTQLNCQ